jgi:hypothetical protein
MPKVKTKKCALSTCRREFQPNAYWQKYHTPRCAWTAHNKRNLALIRRGKKSLKEEQERGGMAQE